ncbi:IclR family transcriptional regulator C-terminal domain-containing protein [Comamonas sp. NoAH]|uniref:IclR family transcriptional regulator domain-containing protein n=1 Tax=Comamonas halotolerans TaxID=3041496 RepID=UPI0024E08344|nr:IclR family transcriptional regulator C-terminal domain-containing protein [Comamonas sp. NoAH]
MKVSDIAHADFIAGLAKGLAVLESFDIERQRLNATLAAQRAGLTRAAARRHLLTLTHLGYLESDGQYFWLAPKVLRLSGSYLASARLPRTVQPALHRLSQMTGLSCSVAVLDGHEMVIVARSSNSQPEILRTVHGLHLGSRLPAHATSTGRIMLANLNDTALEQWFAKYPLPRLTAYTVTSLQQLMSILYLVRQQDHALACEEHEVGVQAIAVPLRDAHGNTLAALNAVSNPHKHTAKQLQRDILPLLQDAARELRPML